MLRQRVRCRLDIFRFRIFRRSNRRRHADKDNIRFPGAGEIGARFQQALPNDPVQYVPGNPVHRTVPGGDAADALRIGIETHGPESARGELDGERKPYVPQSRHAHDRLPGRDFVRQFARGARSERSARSAQRRRLRMYRLIIHI